MTMQFCRKNEVNTTTQIAVDSVNTATVRYLFDRDLLTRFETVGYGTNTSTNITISFSSAVVVDRIFLQNHNLKQYRVFYNGATSNTFTPNISETTNSQSCSFYSVNTTTVTSITLQVDLAQSADTEKKIGEFYVGSRMFDFERNPSAADYKPMIDRHQVIHKMPNGGVNVFVVDDKFTAEIKWKFITESFTSQLLNLYETATAFTFIPFGTTTSWDGRAYEVAWTSDFDFRHADNNKTAGYSGRIIIQETA